MGTAITDEMVSARLAEIVGAATGAQAFALLQPPHTSRTMLRRLADLTHAPEWYGPTGNVLHVLRDAGWSDPERDVPRDGFGPCVDGFSAHSRRPWECRHCARHRDDHRHVPSA